LHINIQIEFILWGRNQVTQIKKSERVTEHFMKKVISISLLIQLALCLPAAAEIIFAPGDYQAINGAIANPSYQAPVNCVVIDMIPGTDPTIVPAGGQFTYDASLDNPCNEDLLRDVWLMLRLPNGSYFGPIGKHRGFTLFANSTLIFHNRTQSIPTFAPLGDYTYISHCGTYPTWIEDSDYFYFTVISSAELSGIDEWEGPEWSDGSDNGIAISNAAIIQNNPNPFNAQTTIQYQLSKDCDVALTIYNIRGQKIETLIDKPMPAGVHQANWDASSYSSGIYFYKLVAGKQIFTKRMTLLK